MGETGKTGTVCGTLPVLTTTESQQTMPRERRIPQVDRQDKRLVSLVRRVAALVRERVVEEASFEDESRAAMAVMADALWLHEQERLEACVSTAERVEIGEHTYRRLSQPSSTTYHGLWGTHEIKEALYRQESVRNGPTLKPLDVRVGVVGERLLPDLGHAVGHLCSGETSREAEATLATLGFRPPSRTLIEKGAHAIGDAIIETQAALDNAVRADEAVAQEVQSVSVGMDRMAVRMDEPLTGDARDEALRRRQGRAYERTPPEPYEYAWRMAWVGSVTTYDADGEALRTVRLGGPASDDPAQLAARLTDEVLHVVEARPDVKVVCVQDGAPDLDVLRQRLREVLPEGVERHHLVDLQHLVGYLGDVVAACEPPGDPHDMLGCYRDKLLGDDGGIDDIFRHLRRKAERTARTETAARTALADAIRYIRKRRPLMRYASVAAANLPVGSGATESACAVFQLRTKRPGSHWRTDGLRAVMAVRGLVSSGRWNAAWTHLAAWHCAEVTPR
jgi:hypothetical protein